MGNAEHLVHMVDFLLPAIRVGTRKITFHIKNETAVHVRAALPKLSIKVASRFIKSRSEISTPPNPCCL